MILAMDTATPAVTAGVVRLEDVAVLAERVTSAGAFTAGPSTRTPSR